jgi:hypothetical protein
MEKRYIILTLIFSFVFVGSVVYLYSNIFTRTCSPTITEAKNLTTGEIRVFNDACLPYGWQEVPPVVVGEEAPLSDFSFRVGDNKKIDNLNIQLTDITDSRCPTDVQCIWAGEVKAIATFSLGDKSESKTLTLLGVEEKILGYIVKFTQVTPGPRQANASVDKKEYVATFI